MKDDRIEVSAPGMGPGYKCDCGCEDYDSDDCCMYECTGCELCERKKEIRPVSSETFINSERRDG